MRARTRRGAIGLLVLVGLGGLVAGVLGGLTRPAAFFHGYLFAFLLWAALPLGALSLLATTYLIPGRWAGGVQRPARALLRTLPLVALAFLPLAFGLEHLYAWSRPAEAAASGALRHKAPYLNASFFLVRAAIYLLVWLVGGLLLQRWSRLTSEGGGRGAPSVAHLRGLAAGLTCAHAVLTGFAAIDWVGSLVGEWYSSVFGLYLFVVQGLAALAVIILWAGAAPAPKAEEPGGLRVDLGGVLLTLVVLQAYLAYSQGYITWVGNTPETIAWYEPRIRGGWRGLGWSLIVIGFALPFLALLFHRLKRSRAALLAVALVVLVGRILDAAWMVLPAGPRAEPGATLLLAAALALGLGGLWVAALLWLAGPLRRPQEVGA